MIFLHVMISAELNFNSKRSIDSCAISKTKYAGEISLLLYI